MSSRRGPFESARLPNWVLFSGGRSVADHRLPTRVSRLPTLVRFSAPGRPFHKVSRRLPLSRRVRRRRSRSHRLNGGSRQTIRSPALMM